jgi:LiaI-LiaF-like transmembrane region
MNPAPPSQARVPPPLPGVRPPTLMGALCAPLLLTTLGILLVVDHLGKLSFGRSWPILLIVFGLCKLTDRMGARA